METLQFRTYEEATAHFGIELPRRFVDDLLIIDRFCQTHQLDTLDTLFDTFGLLRIEGKEARYQQTPIEFFPFGSIGSDGIHYGFVIHTLDEDDYPAGEICPMDDDGVVVIANSSTELFQNLLCDNTILNNYPTLYEKLKLTNTIADRKRYDQKGNVLSVSVKPKKDWTFLNTKDGAGVFAEDKYFNNFHQTKYDASNTGKGLAAFQSLADEMKSRGLYASQLYYLKESYWYEWTNPEIAKDLLTQMLEPYEKLNRPHLYDMTKWVIETF